VTEPGVFPIVDAGTAGDAPLVPPRVLIVDDDEGCIALETQLVEDAGAVVVGTAGTAAEALQLSQQLTPSAVLLDVNLPDGDGVDVAAAMTRHESPPRVVLVSADPDAVSPAAVVACGASAFVPKTELADADLAGLLGR
jgi:DNA-binding NarL/FixJ family response regulator